ncbi:MAG: response regulator transcription factor [Chloroflexi bacterium]|nr:response regulator transcription factor [Chloroflexota bacterium]
MSQSLSRDKILVVEDDLDALGFVRKCLEKPGYDVIEATDGLAGLREFFRARPDLVLLDVVMPGMDGWEVCRRIREVSNVPIIMLSARGEEMDRVKGLSLGADDYVSKPFGSRELLARVGSALRRARSSTDTETQVVYNDGVLSIDHGQHEVYVLGRRVDVSPLEYRVLACLTQHPGQVLTHEQILERVWGPGYESKDTVKLYISYLRKKIEADPAKPELIQTMRGVGYRYRRPTS